MEYRYELSEDEQYLRVSLTVASNRCVMYKLRGHVDFTTIEKVRCDWYEVNGDHIEPWNVFERKSRMRKIAQGYYKLSGFSKRAGQNISMVYEKISNGGFDEI